LKKNLGIAISAIIIFLIIGIVIAKNDIVVNKSDVILDVFSRYKFDVLQINTRATAIIAKKEMDFSEVQEIINQALETLEINGDVYIDKNQTEFETLYEVTRSADNIQTIINVKSVKAYENQKIKPSTTLTISIVLYNNENSIMYVQNKLKNVFNLFNVKPDINITMAGTYDKKITGKDSKKLVNRIVGSVKGEIIEEYETDRLYSVYGYTNLLSDSTKILEKKVNIHVATRYNEYEKKTYLYFASPVISVDY